MKKLITILAIMIVLVGAVFASDPGYKPTDQPASTKSSGDGDAIINVTATIGSEWPKFQLATKTGAAVVPSAVGGNADAALSSANISALTEADSGSVTVTFGINQISDSRTTDSYTLTVTATNLVLVQPLGGDVIAWNTAVATEDVTRRFVTTTPDPTISKKTVDNITMDDSVDGTLAVEYNGKKVKAGVSAPLDLATFDVSWTKNTNAQAGDYKSVITLHVQAD